MFPLEWLIRTNFDSIEEFLLTSQLIEYIKSLIGKFGEKSHFFHVLLHADLFTIFRAVTGL